METAFFSAASLFHADDDSDDDGGGTRDEAQVGAEGESQQPALEYEERIHKFPGVDLSIREFSSHQLNANLLWPGTFFFADWLVKNPSILDGQRILELGRINEVYVVLAICIIDDQKAILLCLYCLTLKSNY
ncbi:hypothetical protein TRIUR3_34397 [Triticum urartu]|uniref:Uncharacterized protein n=2 Tax=Triticum TaxID=4564 RepID=A0A9R0W3W3_TRITD|nr:hypothetical protein TRIUR3_34397 [Triticum urartu]VAH97708.1 unnamed protein product [Triticum turgidum subsp. durum]